MFYFDATLWDKANAERTRLHVATSKSLNFRKAGLLQRALRDRKFCEDEPIEIHSEGEIKATTVSKLALEY